MLVNNCNAYKYVLPRPTSTKNVTSGHGLRSVLQSCICTYNIYSDSRLLYNVNNTHRYVGRKKSIVLKINFLFVKKVEDTNIKAKPKKKGDSLTQMMMKAQLRKTDDEDDEKEKARIYRKTGYTEQQFCF